MGIPSTSEIRKGIERNMIAVPIYPPPGVTAIRTQSRRPTKPVFQHTQQIKLDTQTSILTNEGVSFAANDERSQVFEAAEWPHSVHGIIAAEMNSTMIWGTGTMIGPNIVLTAGHNLYDFATKTFANVKSLQFLPGVNGKMLPSGAVKVKRCFVSPNYIKDGKQDYGILILQKPIGQMTGYFGLACLDSPEDMKAKTINVTACLNDKTAEASNDCKTWTMEPEAYEIDQETGHIRYPIETGEGQNGGGVWYQEGEDYYVCGVHRGAQAVGQATLLTQDIYKQIYSWLQEVGFKETVLKLEDGKLGDGKRLFFGQFQPNTQFFSILESYKLYDLESLEIWAAINGGNKLCKEIKKFGQSTSWTNLSHLKLWRLYLGTEGARALAQNTSWVKLQSLDLGRTNLGAEGVKALAQNTSWVNLQVLRLQDDTITPEGMRELAQNTSWINLTELCVLGSKLGSEGGTLLAQNTSWKKLSKLSACCQHLDSVAAYAFSQNPSWINLSHLHLSSNNLRIEGARALAQNTSWVNLSSLDLSMNNITAEGAKQLAMNKSWINLSRLNLSCNSIGPAGGYALALNTSWINLSDLSLAANHLGCEGAEGLAENTSWINLSKIDFEDNDTDPDFTKKVLMQNKFWKKNIEIKTYEKPPPPVEDADSDR